MKKSIKALAVVALLAVASCQKTMPEPSAPKTPAHAHSSHRISSGGLMYLGTPQDVGGGEIGCFQPCGFCHVVRRPADYIFQNYPANNEAPTEVWVDAQGHLFLSANLSYTPMYLAEITESEHFNVAMDSEIPQELVDEACDGAGMPHFSDAVMIRADDYPVEVTPGGTILELEGEFNGEWVWHMRLTTGGPDAWMSGTYHNMICSEIEPHIVAGEFPSIADFDANAPQLVYAYVQANIPEYSSVTFPDVEGMIAVNNNFFGNDPINDLHVAQTVEERMTLLEDQGLVAPGEKDILVAMFSAIEDARWHGPAGVQEIESAIMQARQEWNAHGYDIANDEGAMSAMTISVAEGSFNHWRDSPVTIDPGSGEMAIPILGLLVGMDAGAAIAGGIATLLGGGGVKDALKYGGICGAIGTLGAVAIVVSLL